MSKSANLKVVLSDADETVKALVMSWGWETAPREILEMAEKSVRAQSTLSGEILVEWGLIPSEVRDHHLANKPPAEHTLSYIAGKEPTRVLPWREQVLALKNGYPFYERLSLLTPHSAMENIAVHRHCEKLDAVLRLVDGLVPVVVFSDFNSLIGYQTLGSAARRDDPIMKALNGVTPKLGVGGRDEISSELKSRVDEGRETGSETGSRVWNTSAEDKQSTEAKEIGRLLDHALQNGATDIALKPFRNGAVQVLIRRWGRLVSPYGEGDRRDKKFIWPAELATKAINLLAAASGANRDMTRKREPTDGQITYKSSVAAAFLRLSFIPLNHQGESRDLRSVSVRLFAQTESSIMLDDLNFPSEIADLIRDAMRMPQGLILFSGPMNSGKSTGIAGSVGEHVAIYGDESKRISVEDPIERHVFGITQVQVPQHLQDESARYNVILRGIKRHDNNLLWVGEVRDAEGAQFCVSFAGSGHLVLSTIHAKDTILSYDILSTMIDDKMRFQLAESMGLCIGMRLAKTLCPHCSPKETWTAPTEADRRLFDMNLRITGEKEELPELLPRANTRPDPNCDCDDGYDGSVPVVEALPFTREVRDAAIALIAGEDMRAQRKVMADARPVTLLQSGLKLLRAGKVDLGSILFF